MIKKVVEQNDANWLPADEFLKAVDQMVNVNVGKFNSSSLVTESREELYQSAKTLYTELVTLSAAIREIGSSVDELADVVFAEGSLLRSSEEDLENEDVRQAKGRELLLDVLGQWKERSCRLEM